MFSGANVQDTVISTLQLSHQTGHIPSQERTPQALQPGHEPALILKASCSLWLNEVSFLSATGASQALAHTPPLLAVLIPLLGSSGPQQLPSLFGSAPRPKLNWAGSQLDVPRSLGKLPRGVKLRLGLQEVTLQDLICGRSEPE